MGSQSRPELITRNGLAALIERAFDYIARYQLGLFKTDLFWLIRSSVVTVTDCNQKLPFRLYYIKLLVFAGLVDICMLQNTGYRELVHDSV